MSRTSTGSSWRRNPPTSPTLAPSTAEEVREALARLGVAPTKLLGQSFLTDAFVADAEAALVDAAPGTPIVEIGGGLGVLTDALLRRGRTPLTVIERDRRLARHLERTFGERITVLAQDALTAPIPPNAVVVGNLPFSVATPILIRLFELRIPRCVAMVQREVAERLAAGPGSKAFGRLSILAALYGTVQLFQTVPAKAFTPRPAVEGQLLVFEPRSGPLPVPSVPDFEEMIRQLFGSRRKQLKNLVPRVVPQGREVDQVIRAAGWPDAWERLRPEALGPAEYFRLAGAVHDPPG
ncbi:MAG: 16S rRNA (adenine(1518)-N(6)/adenine(1519)-N(6))-dimethyltransferase RsmA [Thermoplasmata archaeon]|nr:16S rRNA (adenine(1518)-N(6)/adenine(1519)-N(6))-dimethyltransferase RsmA [Thermoplasmata archaeon]